ncbi:MAG: hypothetical protein ACLPH3_02380 [Terracidiphilus sp.]
MTTRATRLAAMSLLRFGGFHGGRDDGFGLFLVSVVLVGVVIWVMMRSDKNAA